MLSFFVAKFLNNCRSLEISFFFASVWFFVAGFLLSLPSFYRFVAAFQPVLYTPSNAAARR